MPRLNPQVNIKNIVIGLMDRLSAYAARELEQSRREIESKDDDHDTHMLMKNLELEDKEKQSTELDPSGNSEELEVYKQATRIGYDEKNRKEQDHTDDINITNGSAKNINGIPEDIKLFEIFYEQVINLVKAQRLPMAEITALLLSLTNLGL